jgi:translation initiation factor 2B subunit (eIF-2B alpha/beta/delta family)
VVGYWKTVKFSGAVPAARVRELTERVEKLQKAVKMAREEANSAQAEKVQTGDTVLGWLFSRGVSILPK